MTQNALQTWLESVYNNEKGTQYWKQITNIPKGQNY